MTFDDIPRVAFQFHSSFFSMNMVKIEKIMWDNNKNVVCERSDCPIVTLAGECLNRDGGEQTARLLLLAFPDAYFTLSWTAYNDVCEGGVAVYKRGACYMMRGSLQGPPLDPEGQAFVQILDEFENSAIEALDDIESQELDPDDANYYALRWSADELRALPTLATGQADDLKIDLGVTRIWISRRTVADGEPFDDKVTVEQLKDGSWVVTAEYPGSWRMSEEASPLPGPDEKGG